MKKIHQYLPKNIKIKPNSPVHILCNITSHYVSNTKLVTSLKVTHHTRPSVYMNSLDMFIFIL